MVLGGWAARDLREEIGDRASGNDSEDEEHQNVYLDIYKSELQSVHERLLMTIHPIVHANILLQTPGGELTFLF